MSFSHIKKKSICSEDVEYQCYVSYDSIEDSEPYGDRMVDRNSIEEASREYWVRTGASGWHRTLQSNIPDKVLAAFDILFD